MPRPAHPLPSMTQGDVLRFWKKVRQGEPDECWPWMAANHAFGYGRFKIAGKLCSSHRIAWELTNGPIPANRLRNGLILHSCHNPQCCNPAHLRLGTPSENNRDAIDAGRWDNVTRNLPWNRRSTG